MTTTFNDDGDSAWRASLRRILEMGVEVAPRGMPTKELLHAHALRVDLARAVVTSAARKLSRRFMAAEAMWILTGDDKLERLVKHVPRMATYSDDGVSLRGAYGPKIVAQLDYVVKALVKDRDTRQAVLTIWERNPAPSKDVPCTVAMTFGIREGKLQMHAFMRSSDAWLGLPYDMFSFSCVGIKVACLYNAVAGGPHYGDPRTEPVGLGALTITASSSHLYLSNAEAARALMDATPSTVTEPAPNAAVLTGDWKAIEARLLAVEDGTRELPWGDL